MAFPSIYNPSLPFINSLNCSLQPGVLIRIKGKTNLSPTNFSINLQCGASINPRSDIALHLSPVFTAPTRVVRNSLIYKQWGAEESHGGFPFSPDTEYEIMILTEIDHFKIAVNNIHFTEFKYRIPINLVSHISGDGDTNILYILFEKSHFNQPSAPLPVGDCPYPTEPFRMPMASAFAPVSAPYVYNPNSAPYSQPTYGSLYQTQSNMPYSQQDTLYASHGMPYAQQGINKYNQEPKTNIPPSYSSNPVAPNQYGAPSKLVPSNYPNPGYPNPGYPTASCNPMAGYPSGYVGGYPQPSSSSSKEGVFSSIPGASKYIDKIKKSSPIPIGGVAAGLGAAALGAALLGNPIKKVKKIYKHKFFKHKFHKGWSPKGWGHKNWSHKGWSSSSSSSSSD